MKIQRFLMIFCMAAAALACSLYDVSPSWAQKPPPPANPQAPTINPLVPTGVQRGQTLDLIVTGANLTNPTGVSLGIPAKITIPTEDKNGQDPGKCKVRIEVPANTPLGWYPFRLATLKGISNLRVICVDDLPNVVSSAANRSKATAQPVIVPCAVSGSVVAEQGDFYKFTVKAGQRLSFDCLARRFGSAIDGQMTVYDAKSMRELAYDNDSPGCQTDPRISYTFKETGEYLVEVRDVLNRGGADFFYRLRIGDFALATTPIPLAAQAAARPRLPSPVLPLTAFLPSMSMCRESDPAVNVVWSCAEERPRGCHGWPVPLALGDLNETVETGAEQRCEIGDAHPRCPRRRHGPLSAERRRRCFCLRRQEGAEARHRRAHAGIRLAEPAVHDLEERQDRGRDRQGRIRGFPRLPINAWSTRPRTTEMSCSKSSTCTSPSDRPNRIASSFGR